MAYSDVEAALLDYFSTLAHCVTSTPPDLAERLADDGKVLRIQRIGGGSDNNNDFPRVSVQTYTATDPDNPRSTLALAEDVRDMLLDLPKWVNGAMLDDSTCESGPVEWPWPDPAISVTQSIYRITVRRQ